jgi:hypothetical protein
MNFIQPRLSLNFLTPVLDPIVTFVRANATATRVNNSGIIEIVDSDTPRFDYDPATLTALGLLIEESRGNLIVYSGDMMNAAWQPVAATKTGGQADLSGGSAAVTLNEGTATSNHFIQSSTAACVANTFYTHSIYVKAGTATVIQLFYSSATHPVTSYANFDLAGGVVGDVGVTATAQIQFFADNWYRCSITSQCTLNGNGRLFVAFTNNNVNAVRLPSYSGTSKTFTIFGGQFESGAFPTSYIPTTTTALARNADVATITGTNFSDFWQATRGGASVLATPSTVSGIRPLVQFDDNTTNEIIALRGNTTNPELYIVDGGVDQAQIDAGAIVANTSYSLTGWWQTNDCKARQNSGATVSDYTATIPTVTQARIGSDGTNYLNGTIATINYYDSFFGRPIYTRRKNKVFPSLL